MQNRTSYPAKGGTLLPVGILRDISFAREVVFVSTLEVRWMLPGQRPAAATRWFNRFTSTTEEREDLYLIHSQLAGISVKIRGSSLLEFKFQQEDGRVLDVPGFAAAPVKSCEKWSFVRPATGEVVPTGGSWKPVRKTRRLARFSATGTPAGIEATGGERAACEAELTDVQIEGQDWWTLALEAVGSGGHAWDALKAASGTLFAEPRPAEVHPGPSDAITYSEWLRPHYDASR